MAIEYPEMAELPHATLPFLGQPFSGMAQLTIAYKVEPIERGVPNLFLIYFLRSQTHTKSGRESGDTRTLSWS